MTIPTRPLGATGLRVSALGLGCSSLGGGVFYRNDAESLRLLHRALERGVTFYDTADAYGYGHSERLIGRAFKTQRCEVIIASKAGFLPSSLARFGTRVLPILAPVRPLLQPWKRPLHRASKKRQDFSSRHIAQALEGTLRRLQTDYVDVYLLHSPPTAVLEQGEVFEALQRLKREGKIRHGGVSAHTIDDALLALREPEVEVLEVAFNLLEQEAAERLFPMVSQRPVGIIARVPLARGLLTDRATRQPGVHHEDLPSLLQRRRAIESLTRGGARPIAHAALQFVLQHPDVSTVIPGTKSIAHLEDNLRALDAPSLTGEEMERLTRVHHSAAVTAAP
jgi:aryl-alcohol dehydrogenase-like predicted oxidoreductase